MANAWPMIRRCKIAQWKGLSEYERDEARTSWQRSRPPNYGVISQAEIVLWHTDHLILISLKEDRITEVDNG